MKNFIPVNQPLFIGNEKKYLNDCIDSGWVSSAGPYVKRFEDEMATVCNRKFGISVSSGTTALEIAIQALGIASGDEVITSDFSIIACSNAIVKNGATPIFVDINPNTFNIDPKLIEEKVTSKTKAILVPHIYGLPAEMDKILDIAKRHNLKVIEDAAQAHGVKYKNSPCGSFGDISIFSFYANKHVSTGEGGMLLTNDEGISKHLKSLRDHCFSTERRFVHHEMGHNYRLTNLQAAVGCAQLECLNTFLDIKKKMGQRYISNLKNIERLQLPIAETDYASNSFWCFPIVLKHKNITLTQIQKELKNKGIGTRPFFWPLHKQPLYKKYNDFNQRDDDFINTNFVADNGLYLPSGLSLKESEIDYVSKVLTDLF